MIDQKLIHLNEALNDDLLLRTLPTALNISSKSQQTDFSIRHRVLKHKPGKHCVIDYSLEPRQTTRQGARVIGKLYRDNRGETNFENLRLLWRASFNNRTRERKLGMPEPLAYLPELGMMILSVVPGRDLYSFNENDDLSAAVELTAENLGVLHGLQITVETKSFDYFFQKQCRPGPEQAIKECPEYASLIREIMQGLQTIRQLNGITCPVHGDLNLGQVFITREQAYFIDFDGLCKSHPALDVANFFAAVETHFPLQSAKLFKIFIDAYLRHQPGKMLNGLSHYRAYAFFRRAMIDLRKKANKNWREDMGKHLRIAHSHLNNSGTF